MPGTTGRSVIESFGVTSDDSMLVGPVLSNRPAPRQLHRQAIAEETLTALEKIIVRYQRSISEVEGDTSSPMINPEALAGEIAGQLAHLRSKLYRYTQLG